MKKEDEDKPLYKLILSSRRTLIYAGLFSLALNLMMLLLPIYSLQVLDRVVSSRSMETLAMLTLITVLALVFYGVFMAIRSYTLQGISQWLDITLAPKLLSQSITRSSLGANAAAGQTQRDLNTIKGFISGGGVATMLDAPWSIIFFLVIYLINPILGFLGVIGAIFLVAFGLINEFATKKVTQKANEYSIQSQNLADISSRNAEAVESMGMMPNILNYWKECHSQASDFHARSNGRGNIIQSISRVIRLIIQIAVTGFGGYLVLQNELTVGGMIASSILVGRALAPFEGAINIWKGWIAARDAYNRLNVSMQATQALERGNLPLPAPQGLLTAENVIYTPPNSPPILKGVSFTVQPGEMLGIIGPSAAGKSTLSKLIVGLLPTTHGAIRLDGAETFKWNREDFGQYVGYLPQHVDLFPGTIKDNIARMQKDASMESVIDAAKRANVHELILRLPNGYETDCATANLNLSPGQRQRIGMARALYGNARFVVLDEPNSNLDGEGERALIDSMRQMRADGITTIVVAHRPTIVSMVDKILVLKAGMVEKFGPRDAILQQYTAAGQQAQAQARSQAQQAPQEQAPQPEQAAGGGA